MVLVLVLVLVLALALALAVARVLALASRLQARNSYLVLPTLFHPARLLLAQLAEPVQAVVAQPSFLQTRPMALPM